MLLLRNGDDLPANLRGGAYAIGNFDGVHRGHKALIAEAVSLATAGGRPAGVIVFEPHPREFFHPEEPHFRLTPLPEKVRILRSLGLDLAVVLDFNAQLARLTADAFIAEVIVDRLAASEVIIGFDFCFGHKRSGTPITLQEAGIRMGFGVHVVGQKGEDGERFSSTTVRVHLAQGDVRGAARVLGHWWRVSGTVIAGNKVGAGLGFPTANIALCAGTALMHGIYAVRVRVADKMYQGAAYFGGRPTVDDGPVWLETFLLDFDGDLYGQELSVEFVGYVRGDRRFAGLDDLKAQIARDCDAARSLLAAAPEHPV